MIRDLKKKKKSHCATDCLQHLHSSGQGAIVCKSHANTPAPITRNASCATWYEGILLCCLLTQVTHRKLLPRRRASKTRNGPLRWKKFAPCESGLHQGQSVSRIAQITSPAEPRCFASRGIGMTSFCLLLCLFISFFFSLSRAPPALCWWRWAK